jgi:hypothetical protein
MKYNLPAYLIILAVGYLIGISVANIIAKKSIEELRNKALLQKHE